MCSFASNRTDLVGYCLAISITLMFIYILERIIHIQTRSTLALQHLNTLCLYDFAFVSQCAHLQPLYATTRKQNMSNEECGINFRSTYYMNFVNYVSF